MKKMLLKIDNEFLIYAIYNKYLSCKKFMKSNKMYMVADGLINNKIIINGVNHRQRP